MQEGNAPYCGSPLEAALGEKKEKIGKRGGQETSVQLAAKTLVGRRVKRLKLPHFRQKETKKKKEDHLVSTSAKNERNNTG